MRRAEAQPKSATGPADRQRASCVTKESTSLADVAQLGTLANALPLSGRLTQINDSPRMASQLQAAGQIQHSPRVAAQRRQFANIPGGAVQREAKEEEAAPTQAKSAQLAEAAPKPNNTGMPDSLKHGVESLSGISMDKVRVHYNSDKPAQLSALAYAQGTDIHIAPGQEKHLPHEAWHVVQQAQGRVSPTRQMKGGVAVNDDSSLEREADVMGNKAKSSETSYSTRTSQQYKKDRFAQVQKSKVHSDTPARQFSPSSIPMQRVFAGKVKELDDDNQLEITIARKAGTGISADQVTDLISLCRKDSASYDTVDSLSIKVRSLMSKISQASPAEKFMYKNGYMPGQFVIAGTHLSRGNCHGYTFGQGGSSILNINRPEQLLNIWDGVAPIVVCLGADLAVHHSAKLQGDFCTQTLPGGPVFITPVAILQQKYAHCLRLPAQMDDFRSAIDKDARATRADAMRIELLDKLRDSEDQQDQAQYEIVLASTDTANPDIQRRIGEIHENYFSG